MLAAWVNPLRVAIDSAVAAFDPELVLLGGGLGIAAASGAGEFSGAGAPGINARWNRQNLEIAPA